MKRVVNQAYEAMGLRNSQVLGSILDGAMRNTPEALAFIDTAMTRGVAAAVAQRDGPFGDYSQRPVPGPPTPKPQRPTRNPGDTAAATGEG